MKDERIKILKMVEDKKITAEEGAKLLEAVESSEKKSETRDDLPGKYRKTLRIRVYEGDLSKPKVNVNIPLLFVKFIGKLLPDKVKAKLDQHDISFQQIMEMVEREEVGKLVEVEEENERVEIYIE